MGRTDGEGEGGEKRVGDSAEDLRDDSAQIQEIGEILVTERATNVEGLAPSDATVHTQDGSDTDGPPLPPADRQRGPVSGAVLPHLRHLIRVPEVDVPPAAWKMLLMGPLGVGIAVFFAVLIGLPVIACCLGGAGEQVLEQAPTEVDGVRVRPGLK